MAIRPRVDERVTHPFFGDGTVVGVSHIPDYVMVQWDNDPPFEYNMGFNPCLVSRYDEGFRRKRNVSEKVIDPAARVSDNADSGPTLTYE